MIPRRQNRRYKGNNYDAADIARLTSQGEKLKHDRSLLNQELRNTEDEVIREELNNRIADLTRHLVLLTERISRIREKSKS